MRASSVRFGRCLALLIVASHGSARGGSPAVVLARGGRALAKIVTPAEPSRAEKFAAEELQIYLRKITGAEFRIVASDRPGYGPAIVIGHHPLAREIIAEMDRRHPDNYDRIAVVVEGNRLFLTAHSQSGILWAAWDWLESLGVRWFLPTELGEYVPKLRDLRLRRQAKYDAPGLAFRGPGYGTHAARVQKVGGPKASLEKEHGMNVGYLHTFRLRLNNNAAYEAADAWVSVGSGHSYDKFLHPKQYFKDHPEWFAMQGGKRNSGGGWQICFTNRAAAREFARRLARSVKGSHEKRGIPVEHLRLAVSPNDTKAYCECENCRELVDKNGSISSLVLHFANMVAEDVRKTYPRARITYYVYSNYGTVPDHVKPGPGVYPDIVFWTLASGTKANHAHPMFSDVNRKYRHIFDWFAAHSDGLSAHTYYGHYEWFTPWPKITQMAHDIKTMARKPNFYGMYSETHQHWGTQGLNIYAHAKLMWDPELDVNRLIDDYCEKAFGRAGVHVRKHFDALQARMDRLGYICGYTVEVPRLLTPDAIAECTRHIDAAEGCLAGMDEGTRWRTNMVIEAWRASAKFGEAVHLFTRGGGLDTRDRILNLTSDVKRFAETELGRWAFEYRIARGRIDRIARRLDVRLDALEAGEHIYDDSLKMGGALKFYAKLQGFQKGLWGYSLRVNGTGRLELPIRAVNGRKITAAKVRWGMTNYAKSVKATVVGRDGREHVLAENMEQAKRDVDVPPAALGGSTLTVRLVMSNQRHDPQIALTRLRLALTVE